MITSLSALYQVMHDARLPRSELDKLIHQRLRAVLVAAYQRVPYYREMLRSVGYDPVKDYRGPQDLAKLPITTKQDLKRHDITAFVQEGTDLSRYFSDSTSGSTGIPLTVYRSPYERAVQIARWLRVLLLNGYAVQQKVMSLTSPARLAEGRSVVQRLGLLRRLAVDYLRPPEALVDIFLDYQPDVLYGNRSHLDLMALELERRGKKPPGLKLLIGTAETIHAHSRRLCREHFGIEMTETYGSVEMGTLAYETPARDGLHLCEDRTYFEFLDEAGMPVPPGVPGRVIVTDLTGTLMPFIRYDQGDRAVVWPEIGTNIQGRRRLARVLGRADDFVVLPDDSLRSWHDFYEIMDKFTGIKQFRVVQSSRLAFQISIVADSDYLHTIHSTLLHAFHQHFPPTMDFEIIPVTHIPPDPNGKIKMFVSEVAHTLV